MGPAGAARKLAAAQMPTARGRSSSVKSAVSAASAITITPAPASPSTALAAMNTPADGAQAQAAEPAPNMARALSITFLRPYRSPSSPAGSMAAASARRYPEENHWRSDSDACSAVASVGSATLRMVPSMFTASTASMRAARASHL